jgi:hypothetical protein
MTSHFKTNDVVPSIVENRSDISSSKLTYNSYSGTDISAQILVPNESQPLVLGDLQTLSYSIHRENKPVRLLGQVSPAGFLKGPRTIAGSLIFVNFEAYTFYRLEQFKKLAYSPMTKNNAPLYGLADMLPPFDILITAQNEYGSFSRMRLLGVSIVDEGGTISIEDLVTESQYTFMARSIEPMTSYKPHFEVDQPLISNHPKVSNSGSVAPVFLS